MKKCIDCNIEKDDSNFWKKKNNLVTFCKDCGKIRNLKNRKNNEKNKEDQKKSYIKNRDKRLKSMKESYEKNKIERLEYAKNKRQQVKNDIELNGLTLPNIKEKKCNSCNQIKNIEMFYIKKTQNIFFEKCKICKIEDSRLYRIQNKDKINIYMRKYIKSSSNNVINRKIQTNLRKRLVNSVKNINKGKTNLKNELLDCSKEQLKKWFEYNLFLDNINFDDYGKIWHIDHVIPCDFFDLNIDENKKICFHWTNIRPLEKHKNLKKGNRIIWSDIFVQEIRLKNFIKENHINEYVLDKWKNGALNTAISNKFEIKQQV